MIKCLYSVNLSSVDPDPSEMDPCDGGMFLEGDSLINYPESGGDYGNNLNCEWEVEQPGAEVKCKSLLPYFYNEAAAEGLRPWSASALLKTLGVGVFLQFLRRT